MTDGAYQLPNDRQIVAIYQLLIESLIRARRWTKDDDFNGLVVTMALTWGRASGRPLDSSTIANIVQLPRTTVKRILDRLVASGEYVSKMDGRRKVYFRKAESLQGVRGAAFDLLVIEQQAHIRKAARILSEMDSETSNATAKCVNKP